MANPWWALRFLSFSALFFCLMLLLFPIASCPMTLRSLIITIQYLGTGSPAPAWLLVHDDRAFCAFKGRKWRFGVVLRTWYGATRIAATYVRLLDDIKA